VPEQSAIFPAHLPRLFLDIETFYAADYSLSKQNTISYVCDPRFHIHGIAVRYPDGRVEFRTDVSTLLAELQRDFGSELERVVVVMHNAGFDYFVLHRRYGIRFAHLADTMLMARLLHGPHDDASLAALASRYKIPAKGDLEFMKGVRSPDAEQLARLRDYAINDVAITARLADILVPQVARLPIELWTMEHSVRLFVERPVPVDAAVVARTRQSLEGGLAQRVAATGLAEPQIRSQAFVDRLDEALAKTGRHAPRKTGKKGTILAVAKTDSGRDELLADPDPAVRVLMEAKVALASAPDARSRLKYLEHAAAAMENTASFLHGYHRAGTGRFAGGEGFNIQNLKKPDAGALNAGVAAGIRAAIHAGTGMTFVSADAAQIEARVLAFLAGQTDLHDSFRDGADIYSEFAAKELGREVHKPTKADPPERAAELRNLRQIGKQAILGLGFGMGAEKFIGSLKAKPALSDLFASGVLNESICAKIVYEYRDRFSRIPEFWKACEAAAQSAVQGCPTQVAGMKFFAEAGTLFIELLSGRRLVYPQARITPPTYETRTYLDRCGMRQTMIQGQPCILYGQGGGTNLYGGIVVENIVQATARDILVDVLYRVESAGLQVVLHCHDSVTLCVPESRAEDAGARLLAAWRSPPTWITGIALDAEVQIGKTLNDV
jgi:DNA polymerase